MKSAREPIERRAFEELANIDRLGVLPLSFANARFATASGEITEDAAFDGKRDKKRESWEADKAAMQQLYAQTLVASVGSVPLLAVSHVQAAGNPGYVVVPEVVLVNPGFFVSALISSKAFMVVRTSIVRTADKAVLHAWTERDESGEGISSGQRVRALARQSSLGVLRTLRAVVSTPAPTASLER